MDDSFRLRNIKDFLLNSLKQCRRYYRFTCAVIQTFRIVPYSFLQDYGIINDVTRDENNKAFYYKKMISF